jgi:hypothetical protein
MNESDISGLATQSTVLLSEQNKKDLKPHFESAPNIISMAGMNKDDLMWNASAASVVETTSNQPIVVVVRGNEEGQKEASGVYFTYLKERHLMRDDQLAQIRNGQPVQLGNIRIKAGTNRPSITETPPPNDDQKRKIIKR